MQHRNKGAVLMLFCLLWGGYAGYENALMRTWPGKSSFEEGAVNKEYLSNNQIQQVLQQAKREGMNIHVSSSDPTALESEGAVSAITFNHFLKRLYIIGLEPQDIQIRAMGENEKVTIAQLKFE